MKLDDPRPTVEVLQPELSGVRRRDIRVSFDLKFDGAEFTAEAGDEFVLSGGGLLGSALGAACPDVLMGAGELFGEFVIHGRFEVRYVESSLSSIGPGPKGIPSRQH